MSLGCLPLFQLLQWRVDSVGTYDGKSRYVITSLPGASCTGQLAPLQPTISESECSSSSARGLRVQSLPPRPASLTDSGYSKWYIDYVPGTANPPKYHVSVVVSF